MKTMKELFNSPIFNSPNEYDINDVIMNLGILLSLPYTKREEPKDDN